MTGHGTVSRPPPNCFRVLLALFFSVAAVSSAHAQNQNLKPPANDDCLACHSDADVKRANGTSLAVDPAVFEHSKHGPLACVDCHEDLATVQEFPHADKLARVNCSMCHDAEASKYHDSIHAWAKEKAGLTAAAPACADCHGTHNIKGPAEATSRVSRANIPATCGSCHQGVDAKYQTSVHAVAAKQGAAAPICSDCHTAHTIQRADTPAWRLSVANECGSCHGDVVESFRRTFHGKVTELGFTRVAACADCHGAHDILPASNPASMVSKTRLVETCGRCHEGANASFVKYDPHPDPRNYARSPVMWWVNRFYVVLISGCFGFFGLHSALWFRRSWRNGKD
jgi:nitrate/TMAO reductase-like tetraheme cytochrome c subunit